MFQGIRVFVQLGFGEAEHHLRTTVARIERACLFKCASGARIVVAIIKQGAKIPPALGPFRVLGNGFAVEKHGLIKAVGFAGNSRLPSGVLRGERPATEKQDAENLTLWRHRLLSYRKTWGGS